VLADRKTFPALIMRLSYHVAFPTPMGSIGASGYFFPIGDSLRPVISDSTPINPPKCYKWWSPFRCSKFRFMLRPDRLLAPRTGTFTSELSFNSVTWNECPI